MRAVAHDHDPKTPRSLGLWALCALFVSACRSDPGAPIELRVGPGAAERKTFRPEAAFAEYVEVPGSGNELHLTLAGYPASCEHFVLPGPGQAQVAVVIVTPAATPLGAGVYPWDGHDAHGGTRTSPDRAYAIPSARLGRRSFVFPPGGSIRLTEVELERGRKLKGLLAFEFAGSAEHAAARISGSFEAGLCRVRSADPGR
jgi:hypothetical protein